MTRTDLLAYLLKSKDRTPEGLTEVFGLEWADPMRDLAELDLIDVQMDRNGAMVFYVTGWKGKNDTPLHQHQAVSRSQEA